LKPERVADGDGDLPGLEARILQRCEQPGGICGSQPVCGWILPITEAVTAAIDRVMLRLVKTTASLVTALASGVIRTPDPRCCWVRYVGRPW
jgi:hypothetical protein